LDLGSPEAVSINANLFEEMVRNMVLQVVGTAVTEQPDGRVPKPVVESTEKVVLFVEPAVRGWY